MHQSRKLIDIATQEDQNPEHQLEIISLNTDLQQRFSPQKKHKNPWIIEPWQNQQQNPSDSPERRPYAPRVAPSMPKKMMKIKPIGQTVSVQPTPKALESANNCNFSIRIRAQNRPSTKHVLKIESENNPMTEKIVLEQRKEKTQRLITPHNEFYEQRDYEQIRSSIRTSVPMIAYPVLTDKPKRRSFRKIEKFHTYISKSLRK